MELHGFRRVVCIKDFLGGGVRNGVVYFMLKGHGVGFFERALLVLKFPSPIFRNRSTYPVNVGRERTLPLKIYGNSTTWE